MSKDKKDKIADLREDYRSGAIHRSDLLGDPLAQFVSWFEDIRAAGISDPNAMILSTVDASGAPSSRTVLLKGLEAGGFEFFTNHESRKGRELAQNPHAALTFLWKSLERQVNVRGAVQRLDAETARAYFATRPRESQLGAWASAQSRPLTDRRALEDQFEAARVRYEGEDVPMPDYWGGYRLIPEVVEFWQGGPGRLHDRFEYARGQGVDWELNRLSP